MSRKAFRISLIGLVVLTSWLSPLPASAQASTSVEANQRYNKAIRSIRNIFNNYHDALDEGAESAENKAVMRSALQSLPNELCDADLMLLVNVWMYYDPPDFPTRELLSPIFFRNKERSLGVVTRRLAHKKKRESPDKPPYLDLVGLQKQLKQ